MIAFLTLGTLEATVDGAPAPAELLWRKNFALLIYLARSPGRRRTRDHLIGLFWGDKEQGAARQSLREALRILRRHTGPNGLETAGGQIMLGQAAVELDLDRFEAGTRAGEWDVAAGLVRGEFLEGFAVPDASGFEDWLGAERLAWRRRCIDTLLRHADRLLNAGRPRDALSAAERALALDPLSAGAVQTAMKSLALTGDRSAALERYDNYAARLKVTTDAEPDTTTATLADRVRRERRWRLREVAPADPPPETRRAPLVGRAGELARLIELWTACRRDTHPAVAVVLGPSGIGKTRVGEELAARVRLDGGSVVAARGVEADREETGSGLLAIAGGGLLDCAGLAATPAVALAAFGGSVPAWVERFSVRSDGSNGLRPGHALGTILRTVGEESPVFLWLDDAHRFDRESLLDLFAAVSDARTARVMLLLTASDYPARPEIDEIRSRLGRDIAGDAVRLEALGDDDLLALVRWALPAYDAVQAERLARRLAIDSAGLPLLTVELLHAIALGMDPGRTATAWPAPEKTLDQTMPGELPDAVVAAIRVGYRQLSAAAQRVLAVLAVLPLPAPVRSLGNASGLDGEPLATALDEVEWKRWVTADARGYAFVARIVRDVVARDLVTPGQRERFLSAAAGEA